MHISKVEVIHIIGSFVAGGAERFVVDLVRAMKRQGLSVGILALSSKKDRVGNVLCDLLREEGIYFSYGTTERVRFNSIFWYIKELYRLKPKIVHLHTPNTELAHLIGMKFYKKKHLLFRTIHCTRIPSNRWYRLAILNIDANLSIMCSYTAENIFSKLIKGDSITVQNGVDFNWPIQTKKLRDDYKKKLGLTSGLYHFLNIGRQAGESLKDNQKAHDTLINAWIKGHLVDQNCQLNLIGDGNLSGQLKELAKNDKSIVFHGIKDNAHEWLLAADCYVMPSRSEGLPIAGIEAAGTGLPCIFTDIGPLKELNPHVVLWVSVDDVEQLSKRLIEIMEAAINIDSSKVVEIRNRFGINDVAKIYGQIYQSNS